MNIGNEAGKSEHNVRILNGQITTGGEAAWESANKYVKIGGAFKLIETAADDAALAVEAFNKPSDSESRNRRHELREQNRRLGRIGSTGLAMPDFSSLLKSMTGGDGGAAALNAELDKLAREAEKAAQEANDAMAAIEAEAQAERERAAAAEQAVLDKRENAYKSFTDSVKSLFGQIKDSILSSFNLPTLGNSVNSITRNIGKLLEKTKGFANDIAQLSGLGLNSALLQQVIQAGPVAGSRLASAIVGGGSAFISQLNSAYGEMGNLASGIAGVGTGSAFANQAVVNNYNIEVNGGVGSGPTIGKAIVDAIKSYERTSGAVWQGA
jgi:vacuolar-type H+-ATPase subunit E/Vma4